MNFKNTKYLLLLLPLLFSATGCDKDKDDKPATGKLTLSFENLINGNPLKLNSTEKYTNPNGDQFRIEKLRYYISNVKLKNKSDGSLFSEPDSYHLITPDQSSHIKSFEFDVPSGEYDLIEFSIGVDPVKNTSLDNTGDLDPNNSMAWDWNTGYKFLLLEGKYFTNLTSTDGGGLIFHIGESKNYKTLQFSLNVSGSPVLDFNSGGNKTATIKVAIEEMWKTPTLVKFDEINNAMFGATAGMIADNYAEGMFTIQSIK